MHNDIRILSISFLVVLFVLAITASGVGLSGAASSIGGREFGYRFDKTRLSRWGYTMLAIMGGCIVWGTIVTRNIGGGIGFCLIVTPFAALGSFISVCYIPRDSKRESNKEKSDKNKNDSKA